MTDPAVPLCNHLKVNGDRCQLAALRGRPFCYFHDETEKRRRISARLTRRLADRRRRTIQLPVLEDPNAIQVALMETINAFIDQRLDHKDASLLFYALQTASANVKSLKLSDPVPKWKFRDELTERANALNDEIHDFNRWERKEKDRLRQELEKEFNDKLAEMKPPLPPPEPAPTQPTQ
jgi:hypothetical protein